MESRPMDVAHGNDRGNNDNGDIYITDSPCTNGYGGVSYNNGDGDVTSPSDDVTQPCDGDVKDISVQLDCEEENDLFLDGC